jgi:hypothetical protein
MSTAALQQREKPSPEEGYALARDRIEKCVRNFARRSGRPEDDLRSDAHAAWVRAHLSYDPNSGDYAAWVGIVVWRELQEEARRRFLKPTARRWGERAGVVRAVTTQGKSPDLPPDWEPNHTLSYTGNRWQLYREPPAFDLDRILFEVSPDAATVIRLALDHPDELAPGAGEEPKPNAHRSLLVSYLIDLGWAVERILESFSEIRDLLSDL